MTPVLESANAAGNLPDCRDHVYGGVPPPAPRLWLYGVPTVPLASEVGVIEITDNEASIE